MARAQGESSLTATFFTARRFAAGSCLIEGVVERHQRQSEFGRPFDRLASLFSTSSCHLPHNFECGAGRQHASFASPPPQFLESGHPNSPEVESRLVDVEGHVLS